MKKQITFLSLLFVLITSCAPEPIMRVYSNDKDFKYYQGLQVVEANSDSLHFRLCNTDVDMMNKWLNYYVEVESLTSKEIIRVNPAKMYLEVKGATKLELVGNHIYAIDPEVELFEIDRGISYENQYYSNRHARNATVGFFALLIDAAIEDKDTDDDTEVYIITDQEVDDKIDHKLTIDAYKDRAHYFKNEALRITDLHPEDIIEGFVHFPLKKDVTNFDLVIITQTDTLRFNYNQLKFKADAKIN